MFSLKLKNVFTHKLLKITMFNLFKKPKPTFTKYIDAEIKLNESSYKPFTSELNIFLEQNKHIQIIESPDSNKIEFKFKKGFYNVSMHYLGRHDITEFQRAYIESFIEENEKLPDKLCLFHLLISKNECKEGLMVEAFIEKGLIYFLFLKYDDDILANYENFEERLIKIDMFSGPSIEKIYKYLRIAFNDFLHELGINEEFCSFFELVTKDKDSKNYISWLKNTNKVCINLEQAQRKI